MYADDIDFVRHSVQWLREHETCEASVLAGWSLTVNQSKTEYAHISRGKDQLEDKWRAVRKLGSLMCAEEDVARRKQLATVAYNKLWPLWKRRDNVRETLRIRLYNASIMPVLTYNSTTWGVQKAVLARLDSFHRRHGGGGGGGGGGDGGGDGSGGGGGGGGGVERSFKPDLRLSSLKPIHAKWVVDVLLDVLKMNDMVMKGWKLAMSVTEPTATILDD